VNATTDSAERQRAQQVQRAQRIFAMIELPRASPASRCRLMLSTRTLGSLTSRTALSTFTQGICANIALRTS
jgi:hypothetical protein